MALHSTTSLKREPQDSSGVRFWGVFHGFTYLGSFDAVYEGLIARALCGFQTLKGFGCSPW